MYLELNSISDFKDAVCKYSEYVKDIMKEVQKKISDAKFNIDVIYFSDKYMDFELDNLREIVNQEYTRKKTSKDEYRKFEILNKRNVITTFSLRTEKDVIFATFTVSVENIVVDFENIFEEINNSLFFYYTQYIKLHYLILKEKEPKFIENNSKFYALIENKYCKK